MIWKDGLLRFGKKQNEGMAKAAVFLLRVYQVSFRPFFLTGCYFFPSCSDYAMQAVKEKGLIRAVPLIVWRLIRCHRFGSRGSPKVRIEYP